MGTWKKNIQSDYAAWTVGRGTSGKIFGALDFWAES